MERAEFYKELEMNYKQLVEYLLNKYGPSKYDYFIKDNFKSKNTKVSRTKEGLFCHHIDEDKAIMLSDPSHAKNNPFSYQKADRLVYCNYLEHMLLHLKIIEGPLNKDANIGELPGLGGIVNYLAPELNGFYTGYEIQRDYLKTAFSLVEENLDEYIVILKRLLLISQHTLLEIFANPERLSKTRMGIFKEEIYKRLVDD